MKIMTPSGKARATKKAWLKRQALTTIQKVRRFIPQVVLAFPDDRY